MIRDIFEYIYMYIFASSLNLHYYRKKGNVSLSFVRLCDDSFSRNFDYTSFFLNYSMYLSHSLSAYRPREIPLNIVDDRLTKVKRWGAGEKKRKRKRERGRGRNRWND